MKKPVLEKFLLAAIKFGLIACLFVPLIVSSSTYFPFVVGKAIVFQMLVELIALLYLILILIAPQYRPRFNWLNGAILIYTGIITFTSLIGIDAYFSFWSNYERMDGLFNFYHFVAFFFILSAVFKSRKAWLQFFRWLLVTFIIIDFIGLLQKVGISSLSGLSGGRAFSTLGNATYFGTLAIFQMFIALFLFLADSNFWWKGFYGLNMLLSLSAVLFSQTRGAVLGIGIGVILFLCLASLFQNDAKERKSAIIKLAVVVFLGGILLLAFSYPKTDITKLLPKRFNIFSGNFSLGTRPYVWKVGVRIWQENLLLGRGRGSYGFLFAPHYDPQIASHESVWFDKPHNKILEVGVNSGILGVLSYLAIFGIALGVLWRKRTIAPKASFALIALTVGYFTQNIFLFDCQASFLWSFSLLAFISYLSLEGKPRSAKSHSGNLPVKIAILALGGTVIVAMFVIGNIRPLMAAQRGIHALILEYQGAPAEKVIPIYRSALSLNTFGNSEIIDEATRPFGTINKKYGKKALLPYLQFTEAEEKKLLQNKPFDLKNRITLAIIYQHEANYDKQYFDKVEELYTDFLKKAPKKLEPYYTLAMIRYAKGDTKGAFAYLDKAFSLNPSYYKTLLEMARLNLMAGNSLKGRVYLANAMNTRMPWQEFFRMSFLKKQDSEWLIKAFSRLAKENPRSARLQLILSGLYASMHDKENMMVHFKKAAQLNPKIVPTVQGAASSK